MNESRRPKDTAYYFEITVGTMIVLGIGLAAFEVALSGGFGEGAQEIALVVNAWIWKITEGIGDAFEFGAGIGDFLQLDTILAKRTDFLQIAKTDAAQALPAIFTP